MYKEDIIAELRGMLSSADGEECVRRTMGLIREFYDCEYVFISEYDKERNIARERFRLDGGVGGLKKIERSIPLDSSGFWQSRMSTDIPIVMGNSSETSVKYPKDCAYLASFGVREWNNYMYIPIRFTEGLPGHLGIRNANAHIKDIGFLEMVSKFIVFYVSKAELQEDLDSVNSIADIMPGICFQCEAAEKSRVLHVNSETYTVFECIPEEFAKMTKDGILDLTYECDRPIAKKAMEELVNGDKRKVEATFRVVTAKGNIRWLLCGMGIIDNRIGKIINGVAYDITAQKAAEENLRISGEMLNLALEQSKVSVWVYDVNEKSIVQAKKSEVHSQIPLKIYNIPQSVIEDGTIHPDTADDYAGMIRRIDSGEPYVKASYKLRTAIGTYCWRNAEYTTIFDDDGNPVRAIGTAATITDKDQVYLNYHREMMYYETTGFYNADYGREKIYDYLRENNGECGIIKIQFTDYDKIAAQYGKMFADAAIIEAGKRIGSFTDGIIIRFGRGCFGALCRKKDEYDALFDGLEKEVHSVYAGDFRIGAILNGQWGSDMIKLNEVLKDCKGERDIWEKNGDMISYTFNFLEKTPDSNAAIQALLGVIGRRYGFDRIVIYESNNDFSANAVAYEWCSDPKYRARKRVIHHQPDDRLIVEIYNKDAGAVLTDNLEIKTMQEPEMAVGICCGIYMDGKVFGAMSCEAAEDKEWAENIKSDIEEISKIISVYVNKARSDSASRAKSRFLSRMSHEIRTPINAISGMTAITRDLVSEVDDPKCKKAEDCLDKIQKSVQYLLKIINDILDMSKIESGKIKLNSIDFDMSLFADTVIETIGAQAESKGIDFVIDINIRNNIVKGDGMRLNQVIVNLLGNALKFTPAGGKIILSISEKEDYCYGISVEDTGIGISHKSIEKIFESFEQADESISYGYGGTGLGLAIAAQIVKMMGSDGIHVDSEPFKGSKFYFTLKLEPGKKEVRKEHRHVQYSFKGKRILVVEDNELNMEVAKTILEMAGFSVECAVNGLKAVDMFCSNGAGYYDAVLMDVRMPVMDGIEAARRIRMSGVDGAKGLPIVALSANAFDSDRRHAMECGMSAYLSKPIDPDTLYETLYNIIEDKCLDKKKNNRYD